eukprot:TRINITY_DN2615_c0_g2_i1.p1 TRINITY_DN2615_c0_g2~~TRINITY_DN2615_c0_g2_i1.p1  ORF type:complete len:839 (-),score=223.05 TRINITY_DN2615_c0_g2_i1:208-2682(-)
MSKLVFALIALAFLVAFTSAETCYDKLRKVNSYTSLKTCMGEAPFVKTDALSIVKTLKRTVPSYVLTGISHNSPEPRFPLQIDLLGELNKIEEKINQGAFTTDLSFQEAITELFVPLRDAHTGYYKPAPYRFTSFVLPVAIRHFVNETSNKQEFRLWVPQPDLVANYTQIYGTAPFPSLLNLDDYRLTKIDNQDALSYLTEFATQKLALTRDANARFNLAVHGYGNGLGYWAWRGQRSLSIPNNEIATLLLESVKDSSADALTLSMHFLGLYTSAKSSSLSSSSSPSPLFSSESKQKIGSGLDDVAAHMTHTLSVLSGVSFAEQKRRLASSLLLPHNTQSSSSAASPSSPLFASEDVSFHQLPSHPEIGVLKITGFLSSTKAFATTVQNGLAYHMAHGGKKLILDLIGNGGGDICLGYSLARFLFPHLTLQQHRVIAGRYDLVSSDLFATFARLASDYAMQNPDKVTCYNDPELGFYFSPCIWVGAEQQNLFSTSSWMTEGPQYTRGGVSQAYSVPLHESCEWEFAQWLAPGTVFPGFSADDILLISDGLCGSTCAVFSSFVQMSGLAKTLVMGGFHEDRLAQFFAFPGGEVEDVTFIRGAAEKFNYTGDLLPPALPQADSLFRFAIREVYPWNGNTVTPLEFVFVPSHFKRGYLYNCSFDNFDMVYNQNIDLFDKCTNALNNTCTVDHGRGLRRCENEHYSDTCAVQYCDAGFMAGNTQDPQSCIPCPAGTYRTQSMSIFECLPCANANSISSHGSVKYTGGSDTEICPVDVSSGLMGTQLGLTVAGTFLGGGLICALVAFCLTRRAFRTSEPINTNDYMRQA